MTNVIADQVRQTLIKHGVSGNIHIHFPDFPYAPEECNQEEDSDKDGGWFEPDPINIEYQKEYKYYQSDRQTWDKMGCFVIQGKLRWPVPIQNTPSSVDKKGKRYHEFNPEWDCDPQQFLGSIGDQGYEKWAYRYVHPHCVIDILCMESQPDKTDLKKDDND